MPTHSSPARPRALTVATALTVLGLVSASCGDDPFAINWVEAPDTVLLYSLARPELNLTSGFNFNQRSAVRIEAAGATGSWDMAVDTREGDIVLLAPTALGVSSRAGIATLTNTTFSDVIEAPGDTAAYVKDVPVVAEMGNIYVVRTNQRIGAFGTRCFYYAKLEPLIVDPDGGTFTFVFDASPVCNDRRLIPPD